ncbi:hypothetical protein APUTEX25_003420, partial [Auxenochlorella protothecoides]
GRNLAQVLPPAWLRQLLLGLRSPGPLHQEEAGALRGGAGAAALLPRPLGSQGQEHRLRVQRGGSRSRVRPGRGPLPWL